MKVFRLIALLISLLMLLSFFCGCQPADEGVPTTTPTETTTAATEPEIIPEYWDAKFPTDGKLHYYFMTSSGLIMKDDATTPEKWGDCCLIVFPNGQTMLLDCGQVGLTSHIVENLKRMGIEKIDYLTITHRHGDHFGGAVTEGGVLDTFPVGQVYTSQIYNANLDNPMIIEEICTEKSIPLQYLYKGDQLTFGDVAMDVLWPENDLTDQHLTETEEINNASLVLKFTYLEHASIFAGDLYKSGEEAFVNAFKEDPQILRAQLLKAPHHGSHTSNSMKFVSAIQPKLAVATGYCQIASNVKSTYEVCQAKILTDRTSGYIHVISDGADITWETSK